MFFDKFPDVTFKIGTHTIKYDDIYRFVEVDKIIAQISTNYDWYTIGDGERPDHVSQHMYKTPDFYWTFFIINSHLKGGISQWPLSSNNLDQYIEKKYGKYGIMTVVPAFWGAQNSYFDIMLNAGRLDMESSWSHDEVEANLDMMKGWDFALPLTNIFHGIDIKSPNLKLRRTVSKNAPQKREAKIELWDPYKYQIWIKDSTDSFLFRENNLLDGNRIELFIDPPAEGVSEEETKAYEDELARFKESVSRNGIETEITENNEFVAVLYVNQFFDQAYNAPNRYVIRGTTELYRGQYIHLRGGDAISYRQEEILKNEEKKKIRVIKPELIYNFVDKFKKVLLSSGRIE